MPDSLLHTRACTLTSRAPRSSRPISKHAVSSAILSFAGSIAAAAAWLEREKEMNIKNIRASRYARAGRASRARAGPEESRHGKVSRVVCFILNPRKVGIREK